MRAAPAIALLLAASALAQPGPGEDAARPSRDVTFYAHVFGAGPLSPMPGNTQFPSGEDDFSRGFTAACSDLAPVSVAAMLVSLSDCESGQAGNVLYLYSTAGFVQNLDIDTFAYEKVHNERGQAKDVLLDATKDVTATLYMSADFHGWLPWALSPDNPAPGVPDPVPFWNWDPGVLTDWVVEATLFTADMGAYQGQASEPPPVDDTLRAGNATVVAQGMSAPQTVLSLDQNLNGHGEVYEFDINLGRPQVDRIAKEKDWVLRFRWWSTTGGHETIAGGGTVQWNLNSGEFYPVRFTLPVKNPFDVELVAPQFVHGKLLILAILNSPWGSYDVDQRSVRLAVTDDAGRPVVPQHVAQLADYSVAHGGHYKPVNVTWVWDYHADQLPPGLYTATVRASNFQGSAWSETAAQFRVRPDGSGEAVSVGRSGQQTFTEAQLRAAEQAASG
jgi:hypothetical protein